MKPPRPEILMVEDNPGDVRLMVEALREGKVRSHVTVAEDGIQAMAILQRRGQYRDAPRPDLILLDLNLPRMPGGEVLAKVKSDTDLRQIPVVIVTTAYVEEDVFNAFDQNANCFVTKPTDLDEYAHVVKMIQDLFLGIGKAGNV
jgi:CheY-like chemotaxis protein